MLPYRVLCTSLAPRTPTAICGARPLRSALEASRPTASRAPLSRRIHAAMHTSLTVSLSPHFKKLHMLRESAEARQALAGGKFRDALRESERMGDIADSCRDNSMRAAAMYFRASVASFSGLWDLELSQLSQLHFLSTSPDFPPHFRTAVALLTASAQLKHHGIASAIPSAEDAAAAGMQ